MLGGIHLNGLEKVLSAIKLIALKWMSWKEKKASHQVAF